MNDEDMNDENINDEDMSNEDIDTVCDTVCDEETVGYIDDEDEDIFISYAEGYEEELKKRACVREE